MATRPAAIALAGLLTILGYLDRPWWLAFPASLVMRLAQRLITISDRGPVDQVAAVLVAGLVNVVALLLLWQLATIIRDRLRVSEPVASRADDTKPP
jgi:hypothetical protein